MLATLGSGIDWTPLPKQLFDATICVMMVAFVAASQVYNPSFAKNFGRCFTAAAAVAGVLLLRKALNDGIGAENWRLAGHPDINWVLNPNAVAAIYAISFGISVGHGLRTDIRKIESMVSAAIAALLFIVVSLTGSRGGMLACICVAMVALLSIRKRAVLVLLLGSSIVCAIFVAVHPEWLKWLLSRSDAERFEIWAHFFNLGLQKPILGYGINFDASFQLRGNTNYTPHNIVVAAFFRGGILALALILVIIGSALVSAIGGARRGWWLPTTSLTAALVLSSVDHEMLPTSFNFYWYVFWLPLSLAAASALATSATAYSQPDTAPLHRDIPQVQADTSERN